MGIEWVELEKTQFLTVEDMNGINNNFSYIKEFLELLNVSVKSLKDVSVTYNISPIDIQQKFNDVETNIQTLQKVLTDILGIDCENYKKFYWHNRPNELQTEVYRWLDWLEEVKTYLNVGESVLTDINDETIIDINDEPIYVLEII